MATEASHVWNITEPGRELLPKITDTADYLPVENGFPSEDLLAFEDVGMISAQHSTPVVPQNVTFSKVVKPNNLIRQSETRAKDRINMHQVSLLMRPPS